MTQDTVRKPSALDRLYGAYLAFRTDMTQWEAHDDCPTCGATLFRDTGTQKYQTRCFNCGTTGAGQRRNWSRVETE